MCIYLQHRNYNHLYNEDIIARTTFANPEISAVIKLPLGFPCQIWWTTWMHQLRCQTFSEGP
jgi:hypothetical protein